MRDLFRLNIQMFAATSTEIKSANTATFGKKLTEAELKPYYDGVLKPAIYETFTLEKYADTVTIPQNVGKTITFRYSGKYVTNGEPLVEGVRPREDEPMSTYEMQLTLQDWGGYITFTDQVDIYSLDKGESTRLQKNQGYAVGELFRKKTRDIFYSSRNRWFAGVDITSSSTLETARAAVGAFNLEDLNNIRAWLVRNDIKPYEGNHYLVLISPEVTATLLSLQKSNDKFSFVEVANYMQNEKAVYDGEIGKWGRFKFVEDPSIVGITSATNGKEVHGCLILGKKGDEKGVKITKLAGKGNPESFPKAPGSSGTNDPINQIGSIGWKVMGWGGAVLYPEAVMVYECLANAVATKLEPNQNENFVREFKNDGTMDTAKSTNDLILDGNSAFNGHVITLVQSYDGKAAGTVARYLTDGKATSVTAIVNGIKADKQIKNDYGTGTSKTVTVYSAVACGSSDAYTPAEITADLTLYVKKQ